MAKRPFEPIEAENIRLRLLDEQDLPLTLAWRNQDHIRRWFFYSAIISPEQHRAWFEKYRAADDDFVFILEDRTRQSRPVGQIAIYHIDWEARSAEFGRLMIGEAYAAGCGLARQATSALVDAAFARLELKEIHLEVLTDNARAIHVYRTCGFMIEESNGTVVRMRKESN